MSDQQAGPERGLRDRLEQFETLFAEAPFGVYLVDADFRIAQVNAAGRPAFGDIPDLIGRDFDEVLRLIWPEDLAGNVSRVFRHTLETGEGYHDPEVASVRADRGTVEYYDWRIARLPLPDGRHGVVCYFSDVSAQVQARHAIARSEDRYRTLFDSIDAGFCVLEVIFDGAGKAVDYKYIEVNATFEQQAGLQNPLGRTIRELVPGIEPHWAEAYGEVVRTGQPRRFIDHVEALGRWFDVYAFRIDAPEERHVAVLFSDITGRKQMEDALRTANEEARQASRAKDEFLAMLGHELRNPLAPMRTALQLMHARDADSRELEVLDRQVRHLTRLVDDLLDVSRITRGKIELRRALVELRDVALRAMELAGPLLEQRRNFLEMDVAGEGLVVDADRDRLAQVVANLLTNASKYSDLGSRIVLTGQRAGDRVRVVVKDEGIGIAADTIAALFEPFIQQPQALDRRQGGLGLGLAIVRSIVAAHGGAVRAESGGAGKGSRFIVELPAAVAAPATLDDAAESARPADRLTGPGRRVLVVDDNPDAALMLQIALEQFGHAVETAGDGPSALSRAQTFEPDVVLLDIGLPLMDGYEVAARLQRQMGPRVPQLIAITGYGQHTDRERSREAGFHHHLVKPIDLDELAELLESQEA